MGQKKYTRKIDKIHKDLKLYQVFMHSFLCQTVLMFSVCILLTKRIDTFWSGGIETFKPEGSETFRG